LPAPQRHPVLLVPGLGGSVLETKLGIPDSEKLPHWTCTRKSSWKRLWLSLTDIVPVQLDCFFWYTKLNWDDNEAINDEPTPQPGVEIRAPRWGSVYAMDYLDPSIIVSALSEYFHPLIKTLTAAGFVDGKDLFGAPFDWRQWPFPAWLDDTRALVEKAYEMNGGSRVVIVSHSMGGVFTYVFLMKQTPEWRSKYVERWVSTSAPFTGTPLALVAMLTGYFFDLPVSQAKAATFSRSVPSIYFLMPNPDFGWKSNHLVETPSKNYTSANITELLLTKTNVPWAERAVARARTFFNKEYEHPGVKVSLFLSNNTKTIVGLRYKTDDALLASHALPDVLPSKCFAEPKPGSDADDSKAPEKLMGDGDGTVAEESLRFACERWKEDCVVLDKVTHFSTIKHPTVIKAVLDSACPTGI